MRGAGFSKDRVNRDPGTSLLRLRRLAALALRSLVDQARPRPAEPPRNYCRDVRDGSIVPVSAYRPVRFMPIEPASCFRLTFSVTGTVDS